MRICVCDTSSLINCGGNLSRISADKIIVPLTAYEELDNISHGQRREAASHARACIRAIEKLQDAQHSTTVVLPSGAELAIVDTSRDDIPSSLASDKPDNIILGAAISAMRDDADAVLLSDDAALRTKARIFGVTARGVTSDKQYMGWRTHFISGARIARFYEQNRLITRLALQPNEFVVLRSNENPKQSALARYDACDEALVPLRYSKTRPWGIAPRNVQQIFLMEALLDPDISIVSVPAPAGTGKTLMSIACGGHMVDTGEYNRMTILKPLYVIGPDIGYLPGDMDEKLAPYMASIHDALDFIFNGKNNKEQWQYLIDKGALELQPVTHLRGRSIPGSYIVVDEAQNLTPAHIKTIITRCGHGTKIILTGDPNQIDNSAVDACDNGLMHATRRFTGQQCFATVTLITTERSALAELGAQLL